MAADTHDEDEEHEHGRRGHEGRLGHEGMRLQQHLDRLTQQLKLTDEQRAKVRTILYNHAKEMIRLQAEIATLRLDVPPLLEAETVEGRATPVHVGRTTQVWDCVVSNLDTGRTIALFRNTQMILPRRA